MGGQFVEPVMWTILHLVSILGLFFLFSGLLGAQLPPIFRHLVVKHNTTSDGVVVGVAWFLAFAVRSIIGLYVYILGGSPKLAIGLSFVVGLAGIFTAKRAYSLTKKCWTCYWRVLKMEPVSGILILGILLCYAVMMFVPMDQWDASVQYVTLAKYFSNGWNAVNLREASLIGLAGRANLMGLATADKILEIGDAQSILGVGDTQLVLLLRWINLAAVSIVLVGFMRLVGVNLRWALLTTSVVLLTPDLIRLGVSGKIDGAIATIELCAATFVILAWYLRAERQLAHQVMYIIFLGFFLSLFAAAGRMSGLYLVGIAGASLLWFVLTTKESFIKKLGSLAISASIFFIFSWLYILMFPDTMYPIGEPIAQVKASYSIQGLYPGLKELYLLFHLALGLENLSMRFSALEMLPHAKSHGVSMFMLSPVMLAIFVAPLHWKCHKVIPIASLIFLTWFVIWSNSIHYSRVFIAGSSIAVLIGGVIASLERGALTLWQHRLSSGIRLGMTVSLALLFPWQIYSTAFRNYDYVIPSSFYDRAVRHDLKVAFLERYTQVTTRATARRSFPTLADVKKIEKILDNYERPIVQTDPKRWGVNILFKKGLFLNPIRRAENIHRDTDCLLVMDNFNLVEQRDIATRFQEKTVIGEDWVLLCRPTA